MRLIIASLAVALSATAAHAQADAITRTKLQEITAPDAAHQVGTYLVTIAPNATVARHTHPGVEMGYVIAGGGTLTIQGQPERTVKPGDSWAIPAGVAHTLHNPQATPEQLVVTFVTEAAKPLAAPAP